MSLCFMAQQIAADTHALLGPVCSWEQNLSLGLKLRFIPNRYSIFACEAVVREYEQGARSQCCIEEKTLAKHFHTGYNILQSRGKIKGKSKSNTTTFRDFHYSVVFSLCFVCLCFLFYLFFLYKQFRILIKHNAVIISM